MKKRVKTDEIVSFLKQGHANTESVAKHFGIHRNTAERKLMNLLVVNKVKREKIGNNFLWSVGE